MSTLSGHGLRELERHLLATSPFCEDLHSSPAPSIAELVADDLPDGIAGRRSRIRTIEGK